MSLSSPVTGGGTSASAYAAAPGAPVGSDTGADGAGSMDEAAPFAMPLVHARWRHFGWGVFWLVLAALFLVGFGAAGKVLGVIVVALAVPSLVAFARTLRHEAGVIQVTDGALKLPVGLCAGRADEIPVGEVKRAYFLRRALPWMTAGPLLVVETRRGAFTYPRDWFEGEGDQERVADGVNRRVASPR